jgi:hypothetical protein
MREDIICCCGVQHLILPYIDLEMPKSYLLLFCLSRVVYGIQPSAQLPVPAPLRELPWGQLNFLQTTDTHGWHAGHLQELVCSYLKLSSSLGACLIEAFLL